MPEDQNIRRRVAAVEERARQAERRLDSLGSRVPNTFHPKDLWIGFTRKSGGTPVTSGPIYPSAGDSTSSFPSAGDTTGGTYPSQDATVFEVELDDPYYPAVVGKKQATSSPRGTKVKAFSLVGWLPPDSPVVVARIRGQGDETSGEWWIISPNHDAKVVTIRITETLHPGQSAVGRLVTWDGTDWTDPDKDADDVLLWDLGYDVANDYTGWNFGLKGEMFQAVWSDEINTSGDPKGAYQTIGSWGLERKGKVYGAAIPKRDSGEGATHGKGEVRIWVNEAVSSPVVTVDAWNDWASAGEVAENDEVWLKWLREDRKWHIVKPGGTGETNPVAQVMIGQDTTPAYQTTQTLPFFGKYKGSLTDAKVDFDGTTVSITEAGWYHVKAQVWLAIVNDEGGTSADIQGEDIDTTNAGASDLTHSHDYDNNGTPATTGSSTPGIGDHSHTITITRWHEFVAAVPGIRLTLNRTGTLETPIAETVYWYHKHHLLAHTNSGVGFDTNEECINLDTVAYFEVGDEIDVTANIVTPDFLVDNITTAPAWKFIEIAVDLNRDSFLSFTRLVTKPTDEATWQDV